MHSITFFNNKVSNKFEIFSESSTYKRKKLVKHFSASASSFSELKKNYKSDNASPTRQLSRFVASSEFQNLGEGHYFACSYETERLTKTGDKQFENVIAFVDSNWTHATVCMRVGRKHETRSFKLIMADKLGKYAGEKSVIYNAFMNKEIEIQEESEINITDVDSLLALVKSLTSKCESLEAKVEALQANNDLLSRRNSKVEATLTKVRKEEKLADIHSDIDALEFEYSNEFQQEVIESITTETTETTESVETIKPEAKETVMSLTEYEVSQLTKEEFDVIVEEKDNLIEQLKAELALLQDENRDMFN